MRKKNVFLIIDAQYDFCNPKGALFVPGADQDMVRLAHLITHQKQAIDHICVTLDAHPINDISHPDFWYDTNHQHPTPFTQITAQEIEEGIWKPRFYAQEAKQYVELLEAQGEFPHFIWPQHCLIGSKGGAIEETLMNALIEWAKTGKYYQAVTKGTYPLTEHFGIFMAQIPTPNRPETQLNTDLIEVLSQFEHIYLCGEAKSHCVATSLKQLMTYAPEVAQKVVIIEDCMSDVPNLGHLGVPIYEQAHQLGLRFTTSANIVLD